MRMTLITITMISMEMEMLSDLALYKALLKEI